MEEAQLQENYIVYKVDGLKNCKLDDVDKISFNCIMQDKNPSKCKLNFQHPSIIQFRDLY